MRINRFLASCGLGSRRSTENLIQAGRVAVNGAVITSPAVFVVPGRDEVRVDGRPVGPPTDRTYLLLNKPEGVVTTASDPHRRPIVLDLVPREPRVFPVGRLDRETSGLLLLTNDGDLAHRVQHPRYRIDKEYEALVEGNPDDDALAHLRDGLRLEGEPRPTAPAEVTVLERRGRRTRLGIVLHEGRNRQVRRMLEAVGHPVIQLRRVRIGPIRLGSLRAGDYRALGPAELSALRRAVRAPSPS